KVGDELFFAGAEILAIAADTEEHARDAVRAVKVEYEELKFHVKEAEALKAKGDTAPPFGKEKDRSNVRRGPGGETETFGKGQKDAEASAEGTYGMPIISHQCLESHGLVAHWGDDDSLTVYYSTQAVAGTPGQFANYFSARGVDLPATKVKCIKHYMGGG